MKSKRKFGEVWDAHLDHYISKGRVRSTGLIFEKFYYINNYFKILKFSNNKFIINFNFSKNNFKVSNL